MATINMHMKFEIEIPKQTWLMFRKPCRLQTNGRMDRRTDKVNPVYPPPTSLGGGIKSKSKKTLFDVGQCKQYNISSHLKWVLVTDKSMHMVIYNKIHIK